MRIILLDPFGQAYQVDTGKLELATAWLKEYLPQMVSPGWYLQVIPTLKGEVDPIPQRAVTPAQLKQVLKTLSKGTKQLSNAGWCDYGNHAYRRPNDPEDINVVARKGESKELCDECAAEIGLIDDYKAPSSPQERHAAITNGG